MRTPPLGHGAVERNVAWDDATILCAALGPGAHVVQHVSLVLRRARERVCADRGRRFERAERPEGRTTRLSQRGEIGQQQAGDC